MVIYYEIGILKNGYKIIGVFSNNDTTTNQLHIDWFNNLFVFEAQINYI
jgi:hypothetical protein